MGFPALHTVRQKSDENLITVVVVEDRGKWKRYSRAGDIFRMDSSEEYDEEGQNIFNNPDSATANMGVPWYGEESYSLESKEDVSDALIKEVLASIKIEKA